MFPETGRIVYEHNPLDRVICQLRFPPVLKIDTEVPAGFQDRIRGVFPNFSEREDLPVPMLSEMPESVRAEFARQLVPLGQKNYEFSSEDDVWHVNLTRSFLALSTKKYGSRSEFRRFLNGPLDALKECYSPAYLTRIGLRYVDVIKRSDLGLDCDWNELLKPHALWVIGSPDVRRYIHKFEPRCEIRLDNYGALVRIAMSLLECDTGRPEKGEQCFIIDTDFSTTNRTPMSDVGPILDSFHIEGLRLFRWLIDDRLHNAMRPKEMPNE